MAIDKAKRKDESGYHRHRLLFDRLISRPKPLFCQETPKAQDSEQVENESETNR